MLSWVQWQAIFPEWRMKYSRSSPPGIAIKFEEMIRCFLQTKSKQFRVYKHLREVCDDEGKLVCFFKTSRDAKKEAAVYIHFLDTVPNDGVVGDHKPLVMINTLPQEIIKLSIFHLRFGNADCHDRNTVTKIDAQRVHRLTPVDHEECFTVTAKEAYTDEVVGYVHVDIAFLKRCGWEVPREVSVPYKIFTHFLKKGVEFKLTADHMAVLAQNIHKSTAFNLSNMLGDMTLEDDIFVQKSHEKIEARLRQYSERFL
ncbi:hypothetical protein DY000_02038024 [Brassica cretica]|uniref:1-phosphatidylinositol 4-kinase n=1 Tax=Brassica cretica TaxID=69181 RepID=A0ABQ7B871_BRACR|nr:hypothetical protein DY000_02038024 [Brassica cretica]